MGSRQLQKSTTLSGEHILRTLDIRSDTISGQEQATKLWFAFTGALTMPDV